jgi:hypothetical protein
MLGWHKDALLLFVSVHLLIAISIDHGLFADRALITPARLA